MNRVPLGSLNAGATRWSSSHFGDALLERESENMQRFRGIALIAAWMLLFVLGTVTRVGAQQAGFLPPATLQGVGAMPVPLELERAISSQIQSTDAVNLDLGGNTLSQEAWDALQRSNVAPLPAPRSTGGLSGGNVIPLVNAPRPAGQAQLQVQNNLVHLTSRGATVADVLALISEQMGLNVVTAEDLNQRVNVTLNGVLLEDALNSILNVNGLVWARQNNIVTISTVNPEKLLAPNVQGKAIQVYSLNYALGEDLNQVILGLLSPIGKSYVMKINQEEQRAAREQLIVEDMPPYIERISQYIAQVDIPPRQVIVEANILQVALKDSNKNGVNFNQLARISNSTVNFQTMGFATRGNPVGAMEINGTDLTGWIECLKSTSDTKTLASPKVAVLNGQEARISVGGKLGYLMTTATQTSTLQSVNFLDYGVVLTVLPIITEDGRVLMKVAPQVSTARINSTSKLPESEATEVSTNVMLNNGQAIVIGGLIKEEKDDGQAKVPFFGDIPLLGRLFQSRSLVKERSEIIVTLLPRIAMPGECECVDYDSQIVQASTRIMDRSLNPVDRSAWEGQVIGAADKRHQWWRFWAKKEPVQPAVARGYAQPPSIPMSEQQPAYNVPWGSSPANSFRGVPTMMQELPISTHRIQPAIQFAPQVNSNSLQGGAPVVQPVPQPSLYEVPTGMVPAQPTVFPDP